MPLILIVAGCGTVPSAGPLAIEIERQSEASKYTIVEVNASVVEALSHYGIAGFKDTFSRSKTSSFVPVVGIGDVLSVRILEAGEGLFSRGSNGYSEFPDIVVDKKGNISIPYAGIVPVKNLTTFEVQDRLVERLSGKAIQPQALVRIVENRHNTAMLNGDVAKPGPYSLSVEGDRLTDVIALAGGTKYPAREMHVTVSRPNGKTSIAATQLLQAVIEDPAENVYVLRGDRIFLNHDPQRYTVLGAVAKPGIYGFETINVNILEAVASAGGLLDSRADSTGLFVFRFEETEVLDSLGIHYNSVKDNKVPTIYRINMGHAQSYFWAQSFLLENKDSIYVSNHNTVEISKALSLIDQVTRPVGNVMRTVDRF